MPYTDGTGGVSIIRVGEYILGPNAIQCEDGAGRAAVLRGLSQRTSAQRMDSSPDSIEQFREEHEERDERSKANEEAEGVPFPEAIPLDPEQARANVVSGIHLHYMTESVPRTSEEGEAEQAGPYQLIPHRINTATGEAVTLYYTARDPESGDDHYIVGPDDVSDFRETAESRIGPARFAYQAGPPHEYEAESARWVEGAMDALMGDGSWSDALIIWATPGDWRCAIPSGRFRPSPRMSRSIECLLHCDRSCAPSAGAPHHTWLRR